MVIGVEPDCSAVRLNTTKTPQKRSNKLHLLEGSVQKVFFLFLFFKTKDSSRDSTLFGLTSCSPSPYGGCKTGPWLHGNALINACIDSNATRTHTHVALCPTMSKARLQKFPLLIVLHARVCAPAKRSADKSCQTE